MPTNRSLDEILDEALKKANTKSAFDYFFKKLNSDVWLDPLGKRGEFNNPPPIREIGNMLEIPVWEPSKYLARMAILAPVKVAEIIKKIPITDNTRIHEDYVKAAIEMPVNESKKIVSIIIKALNNPYKFSLPEIISKLAVHFFKNGAPIEGIKILRSLLSIDECSYKDRKYNHMFINDWSYNDNIKNIYSSISLLDSKIKFKDILCKKLDKCIRLDQNEIKSQRDISFRDFSCAWRETVEKPNIENNEDIKDILINWIIKSSIDIAGESDEYLGILISDYLKEPYPIFSRIALYIAQNNLESTTLILSLLIDKKLATATDVWHEYALLLESSFNYFNINDKNKILDFIDGLYNLNGKNRDESERNKRMRYRFLYLIKDFLSEKYLTEFNKFKAQFGEIEKPTFLMYTIGITMGPQSPINAIEIGQKSINEVAEFLTNWIPTSHDFIGETYNGMGRILYPVNLPHLLIAN